MFRDIHEGRGGPEEVTVEKLALGHHHPGVVEERVEFRARTELLLLGRAGFLRRLLGDRVKLDSFLHLLYGAVEVSSRLWKFLVCLGLGRVGEHELGIVVFIRLLHRVECLLIVFGTVEIYIVAGRERMPIS